MALKEKHGAKGEIILNHDWYEDNQGMNEYFNRCAKLEADPEDEAFVILTIEDGKFDPRKGHNQSKKRIKILAMALIDLIEKNNI